MLTKILAGGFVLVMLGAVVIGAITLFTDRQETNAHLGYNARGQNIARGPAANGYSTPKSAPQGDAPQGGYGRGQGIGRGQGAGSESLVVDSVRQTIEGVVIETTELVIETDAGETVQVGLGPSHYREAQGFVLNAGNQVQVSGYWQDGEFKAIQITNLDTGDNIILRDASGWPMWAGQGRGRNRG